MPDEIMNTMHEVGMPGSHHWLFWFGIAAVFAVLLFLVWWVAIRGKIPK